jgi:hypothetical protein
VINEWIVARRTSLAWIALGVFSWPVAFAATWFAWPAVAPREAPIDRLALVLQLAAVPSIVLFLMLQSQWRVLDAPGAENPFAGAESRRYKVNARVFQNTLEQTLMFVPVLVALGLRIAPDRMNVLAILVAVWTAGRLLFWGGYHMGIAQRSIGMDWTILTLTTTVVWYASTWF